MNIETQAKIQTYCLIGIALCFIIGILITLALHIQVVMQVLIFIFIILGIWKFVEIMIRLYHIIR